MEKLMLDDRIFNIKIYSPTCMSCKHLTSLENRTCKAFPKEIPLEIWNGENGHKSPYSGDGGIQYERGD